MDTQQQTVDAAAHAGAFSAAGTPSESSRHAERVSVRLARLGVEPGHRATAQDVRDLLAAAPGKVGRLVVALIAHDGAMIARAADLLDLPRARVRDLLRSAVRRVTDASGRQTRAEQLRVMFIGQPPGPGERLLGTRAGMPRRRDESKQQLA